MIFGRPERCPPPIIAACLLLLALTACNQKPAPTSTGKEGGPAADKLARPAEKKSDSATTASKSGGSAEAREAAENAALAAKVKSALRSDPDLKNLGIDVTASGGVVTLHGTVDTPAHLKKSVQVASKVEGVKSVKNGLVLLSGS